MWSIVDERGVEYQTPVVEGVVSRKKLNPLFFLLSCPAILFVVFTPSLHYPRTS